MKSTLLTQDLLFEIGTEELPTKAVKLLSEALSANIKTELDAHKLSFAEIIPYGTPRRIAVLVKKLAVVQPDYTIEKRGPALKAAYDNQQNFTPAALGFAKSCDVSPDKLTILETNKGSWLIHKVSVKGSKTAVLLEQIISNAIKNLPIPKPMRWNNHAFAFARPIHWMLLLFGEKTIKINLLGVTSSNKTYGHRFLAPKAITVNQPKNYEKLLHKAYVVASFDTRLELITEQVKKLAASFKLKAITKSSLLQEVTALVEWPHALMGTFNANFLKVPQECLITSMESHQKYFPMVNSKNILQSCFIFISNIKSKNFKQVIQGNERVLGARLSDAEFFFENDKQSKLVARLPKLANITYQRKLGNLLDKTNRIKKLCGSIKDLLSKNNIAVNSDALLTAAELCKVDLVTEMVYEFPELQGIMGKYYAKHDGLDILVADSLEQYYLPKQAGDSLPSSTEACILSIADKLDTIVGIFAIGEIPTGDKDPFGLRRAALGTLRILIEKELVLDLKDLIKVAVENYKPVLSLNEQQSNEIINNCLSFCFERLKSYYLDHNISLNLFYSVYNLNKGNALTTSPYDLHQRLQATNNFQKLPQATQLIAANKRVKNILSKQKLHGSMVNIDKSCLQEAAEINLCTLLEEKTKALQPLFSNNDYRNILIALADLQKPIDNFFDNVMVMCEDEKLKNNRILLLQKIQDLFNKVADISELQ